VKTRVPQGRRAPAAQPQPEQFALDGFAQQAPTDRLFFAIFPDVAARERIAQIAHEVGLRHGLRGDPLRTDRFHVTLLHLGDHAGVPQGVVDAATRAAMSLDCAGFEATFDRTGGFSGGDRKPCILLEADGDSALRDFQRALCMRLAGGGLGHFVKRNFTAHVTLRYVPTMLPIEAVAPLRWSVREFVLVHSLIGRTEYRILGRWALRD